jgi:cell filamentation protein
MSDPYVYPGTNVLRNKLDLRDQAELDVFERRATEIGLYRFNPRKLKLPIGVPRLKAIHKAIFGEVYDWAGEFRQNTGSMQKFRPQGYPVVYPPSTYLPQEMDRIFAALKAEDNLRGLPLEAFASRAAHFYGEMDGAHPFREGNSRTLRQLFVDIAAGAGFTLDWSLISAEPNGRETLYLARDEAAMKRNTAPLAAIFRRALSIK